MLSSCSRAARATYGLNWVYRLRAGGNVSSVTAAARGGRARTPMRCRSRAWPPRRRRRGSGWLVLWFDAVLAEQRAEPLDLATELLALLGQNRQGRVPGCPLFLACGLAGEQFLLPVTQLCGLLILLGIGDGVPLAEDPADLLVQVTGVRSGAHPLLKGRQPALDRVQASLHLSHQRAFP